MVSRSRARHPLRNSISPFSLLKIYKIDFYCCAAKAASSAAVEYIHRGLGTRNNCYNFTSFYELIAKWLVTAHDGNELLFNSLSFRATATYRFVFQVSADVFYLLHRFAASYPRKMRDFLVRNCFLHAFVLNCRVSFYLTQYVTQAGVCLVSVHGARCPTMAGHRNSLSPVDRPAVVCVSSTILRQTSSTRHCSPLPHL